MQESWRSTSNTAAYLIIYRRNLPNEHFSVFVLSNFNYCSLVWNFCGAEYTSKMERIQFRALKFVYNDFNTSYTELLARVNLPTLQLHRKREILVEVFKSVNKMSPSFMWDLFKVKDITYNLRSNRNVCLNHCRTKRYGLDSLSYHGAHASMELVTE